MNWLDIVILVALIIPVFTGLKQGLIKAALTLAGLIVGVVLAGNFYQQVGGILGFIDNEDVANVVAYILILVIVMIIAGVVATLLKFTAKAILLGWVDHLGGAIFGVLMGAIFMGALLAALGKFIPGTTGLIGDSFLANMILDKFWLVLALLPSEFDAVRDFFQ